MATRRRASDRSRRKQRGAYYTPAPIARHILRLALTSEMGSGGFLSNESLTLPTDAQIKGPPNLLPRILDPACGDGVFLLEAASMLAEAHAGSMPTTKSAAVKWRTRLVERCLHGIDIDRQAVADTRRRLTEWILDRSPDESSQRDASIAPMLERNIVHGNALLDAADDEVHEIVTPAPAVDFAKLCRNGNRAFVGFNCIVGNPPYVNIRLASQTLDPTLREYYSRRYRTARGAYDQYVLFLERGCELLRPGGSYAWIVPNKLAGAGYAQACREILHRETTIEHWEDRSQEKVFADAGVYPHIIAGRKEVPQDKGRDWKLGGTFEVEHRMATTPLGELARLHSGATGFQAQALAAELIEGAPRGKQRAAFGFITSGNIDRYRIDDQNVRFMKRRFARAWLPHDCPLLTENKRRLYSSHKLVIAGMTQRLEAAYDQQGRGLGVQVYAAIDFACDPYYLLGLLNSRLLSHLFRQRFAAKQLSGGYLAINKAQLVQLPIAKAGLEIEHIAALARQVENVVRIERKSGRELAKRNRLEEKLDRCVYSLYRLTDAEMGEIDRAFAKAA